MSRNAVTLLLLISLCLCFHYIFVAGWASVSDEVVFAELDDCAEQEGISLLQRQSHYLDAKDYPFTHMGGPIALAAVGSWRTVVSKHLGLQQVLDPFRHVQGAPYTYSANAGLLGTTLGAISYGCVLAFPKLVKPSTSGIAYQFYLAIGFLVSVAIALPCLGEHLIVTGYSLLSGALLALLLAVSLASIWTIGLSWFSQIQPPLATVVGFIWGHYIFQLPSKSMLVACVGIVLIIVGITAANYVIYRRVQLQPELNDRKEVPKDGLTMVIGVSQAIMGGLLGGSFLVPCHFAPAQFANVSFCFGLSLSFFMCSAAAVFALVVIDAFNVEVTVKGGTGHIIGRFDMFDSSWIGICHGILFGISNICTLYGCFSPVGVGVTTAVRNSAGCASILWGAFAFKEFGVLDFSFKVQLLGAAAIVIPGIILLLSFGES